MKKLLVCVVVSMLGCPGCGDPEKGHIWKDQTDMLDEAGAVEDMMLEADRQQRQQIEELGR